MQRVGNADHVIDGVYVGGARAIYHIPELRTAGIKHVLKLYFDETDWDQWPEDFVVCHNPLNDGEFIPLETLQRGVSFIKEHVAAGEPVLVMCGAGISRSSTFVLAYLLDSGYSLYDAWQLLRKQHPEAWPLPALWQSLIEHYHLPHRVEEVVGWILDTH
jgi:protein-tyrosine phosphatase